MLLTPVKKKKKARSFESRRNSFFFLPGVDAPHVYVSAWALGCSHSNLSEGADRVESLEIKKLAWLRLMWHN